jgi:hypothetical protein
MEELLRARRSWNYPGRFPLERAAIPPDDTGDFPSRNTASMKSSEIPEIDRFFAVLSDLGTYKTK